MNSIISFNQSSFILGQLIIDNILLAHKLINSMENFRKCKIEKIAVKLDMSKAFDRVEWQYIELAMQALVFK